MTSQTISDRQNEFISEVNKKPDEWGASEIDRYCRFVAMKEKERILKNQKVTKGEGYVRN